MDNLIPLMSQIQSIVGPFGLSHDQIDLPQIAVVGAQSVGKSSVIEALIKKDFLPRGTGIVTRRPIMIQLFHSTEQQEYALFDHLPDRKFSDFTLVRDEIIRETEKSLGKQKAISSEIIFLKIYSPKVINLTLIDLPGITKVPVGDQPSDIENQIRTMIKKFISNQNCIILAITAANTDIANSDSLNIAREVDPDGTRTIGVLTKCDTLDEFHDALDSLLGKIYPLKLGYVGVVCRSQRYTNDNKTLEQVLQYEENYFSNHPAYKIIKSGCGIPYLASRLNAILINHILDSIPNLKSRLTELLCNTEKELRDYDDPVSIDSDKGSLLLNFFSRFSRYFEDAVNGKLLNQSVGQISGGARINYIFHDWYCKELGDFDPLTGLSDSEIRATIRNSSGPKSPIFVPEAAFEILVKKQILYLESPSLKCVEQVFLELKDIVTTCDLPEMRRFLNLKKNITNVVVKVLTRLLDPTNQMIRNIIQMQTAYINNDHPEFLLSVAATFQANNDNTTPNPSSPDTPESPLTQGVIDQRNKLLPLSKPMESSMRANNKYNGTNNKHSGMNKFNNPDKNKQNSSVIFSFFTKDSTIRDRNINSGPLDPNSNQNYNPQESYDKENTSFLNQDYQQNSYHMFDLSSSPNFNIPSIPTTKRDIEETKITKTLIHIYFSIVRQIVSDSVPKAIMYFLVNNSKELIPRQLVGDLYKESLFEELLIENPEIKNNRVYLKEFQGKLKKALEILNSIPMHFYNRARMEKYSNF